MTRTSCRRRGRTKTVVLLAASVVLHAQAAAQDTTTRTSAPPTVVRMKPAWITRTDAARASIAVLGVGIVSLADEGVAKHLQRPSLQAHTALRRSANTIQVVGDPGALLISASLYVIGSASHNPGLADAGKHSAESIAASAVVVQVLKLSVGRERPNLSHDQDAYKFHPFHGYQTDFNSFPSGHTTASFAAASAFSNEIRRTHPGARNVATPLLYGMATLVGASRMYNDRHWLSDVVGGALIGHFVGQRITKHAHGSK